MTDKCDNKCDAIKTLEHRFDRLDTRIDTVMEELLQINRTLSRNTASLEVHIAGVNTLKQIVEMNKEESEHETERLEEALDKDEERISALELDIKAKKLSAEAVGKYILTGTKISAIIITVLSALYAGINHRTDLLNVLKTILGL